MKGKETGSTANERARTSFEVGVEGQLVLLDVGSAGRESDETVGGEEKVSGGTGGTDDVEGAGRRSHVYPLLSRTQAIMLVLSLTLAMVLNIMNVQAVIIAIQHIGRDLRIEITSYQWLISAYSLAFGSTLLLFGRLADIFGHKRVFLMGMAWSVVFSIGAGLAPNVTGLIILRALQGIGAGASIPAALGILGSSFPPSQAKSTAFATFSAGAPLGGSLGAVLGGVLTEYAPAGWRAIFYVSAGLAAMIAMSAWYFVPADGPVEKENRNVDWIGAALVTAGLVLVTFTLAGGEGAPQGWRTPYILALFALGLSLLGAFWLWEKHVEFATSGVPLMRTSLWHKGRFAVVQLIAALGWSAFSSYMFFATLFYQDYQLLPPILTTIRFLPSSITGLILNALVAILASRVQAQYLIILGALGTALAPLLFAIQDVNAPYWQFNFPGMILTVFGADFIFSCGTLYVSQVAASDEQALAGGIFNMTTQIGTAFGLAIMTIIQSKVVQSEVEKGGGVYDPNSTNVPLEATLAGLRAAFWGCAAFAFVAMIIAIVGLKGIGKVGHRAPKMKDKETFPDAETEEEKQSIP